MSEATEKAGPLHRIGKALFGAGHKETGKKIMGAALEVGVGAVSGNPVGAIVNVIGRAVGAPNSSEEEVADIVEKMTADQLAALTALKDQETQIALKEIDREINTENQLTRRLEIDVMSGSWLTTHIRPIMLIALNASAVLYTKTILWFSVLIISINHFSGGEPIDIGPFFMNLLLSCLGALWGAATVANSFYFKGRTREKSEGIRASLQSLFQSKQ